MPKFLNKPVNIQNISNMRYSEHLTEQDISQIQANCLFASFKKGEYVSHQDSKASHALYLSSGSVKMVIEGKFKCIILRIIGANHFIGLQSLFTNDQSHHFSLVCIEESEVCLIDTNVFVDIAKRNANYLYQLTQAISHCVNFSYKRIIDLNQKQVQGRLADTILYLADQVYGNTKFPLTLNRREIAEMSGMTMENAVRTLSEFRKDNIIEISGKTIEIKKRNILEKLSEIG